MWAVFPYLLTFSYAATATAATVTAPAAAAAAEKTFSDKTLIRPSVIMSWKSLAHETS